MIKIRPEKFIWELKNEVNKTHTRWLFITLVFGYFTYAFSQPRTNFPEYLPFFNWFYIICLVLGYSASNLIAAFYLYQVKNDKIKMHPFVKYLTMMLDMAAVSLVVLPTGGEKSIFFLLYLIVIVSNSMRFGLKVTVASLFALNIFYALALAYIHYPHFVLPGLDREILKISGLWVVGLYIGYLSRRFEIMQGEVEKYQQLVQELLAKNGEKVNKI
jgi:hypothetical protein